MAATDDGENYRKTDWRLSDRLQRKGLLKRALYVVLRPALEWNARRRLSRSFLAAVRPDAVYFSRGTPLEWRRRWAARRTPMAGATVLVQGTGTGWDVVSWAELRPARIVATDLFEFAGSWDEVARYCRDRLGVPVTFRAAPLEDVGFLADGAVDLCVSDAVFEHCRHFDRVLAETRRVLRPGGAVYASYGPLWYGPGGDHFSGRGGLEHVYDHLLLDKAGYRDYVARHRLPVEDFQSGGRYIELDLFSRLATRQYLAAFGAAGLAVDGLIVELSPLALAFRRRWPQRFAAILARHPAASADDLLVKANLVRLVKRDRRG